jgi:hypothetical protein
MPTFNLNHEVLGHRANELPAIDTSDAPAWAKQLTLDGKPRNISDIPAHPDHYLRWLGSNSDYSEGWDQLAAEWRRDIDTGNRHFAALERAGLQVVPQRHTGIYSTGPYSPSVLHTVVPKYEGLVTLDTKKADHASAIADLIGMLATYTDDVAKTNEHTYLYDLYGAAQSSITAQGNLMLHDPELRLSAVTPLTAQRCHPMRHSLANMVVGIELDLETLGQHEEVARIQEISEAAVCSHAASLRADFYYCYDDLSHARLIADSA